MSDPIHSPDLEGKGHHTQVENVIEPDEKAAAANMKADAIEAENAEHALGVIAAVKAYPMATLCAFVSCPPPLLASAQSGTGTALSMRHCMAMMVATADTKEHLG